MEAINRRLGPLPNPRQVRLGVRVACVSMAAYVLLANLIGFVIPFIDGSYRAWWLVSFIVCLGSSFVVFGVVLTTASDFVISGPNCPRARATVSIFAIGNLLDWIRFSRILESEDLLRILYLSTSTLDVLGVIYLFSYLSRILTQFGDCRLSRFTATAGALFALGQGLSGFGGIAIRSAYFRQFVSQMSFLIVQIAVYLFTGLLAFAVLWKFSNRIERLAARRCWYCGYELQGLVESRCPECGIEFVKAAGTVAPEDATPSN